MGNWTTDKTTEYRNVRIVGDAKFFAASAAQGDQKGKTAATFITVVDGTKNGEDIFVDAKLVRGAENLADLKKGDELSVKGTVEFSLDNKGNMRGKIWDATVSLPTATREALKARRGARDAAAAEAEQAVATTTDAEASEAPAFE
jgi:hypothetical protein